MPNTISEDVLRGIEAALRAHAPNLLASFYTITNGGDLERSELKRGDSIYRKLSAGVPWEEGVKILRALEAIEHKLGFQAKFADRQINFLVGQWRRFSEPKQIHTPPSGSTCP